MSEILSACQGPIASPNCVLLQRLDYFTFFKRAHSHKRGTKMSWILKFIAQHFSACFGLNWKPLSFRWNCSIEWLGMNSLSVYTQTPSRRWGLHLMCASSVVFVRARRRVNPVICSAFLLIVPVGHGSKKANSFVIAATASKSAPAFAIYFSIALTWSDRLLQITPLSST